MVMSEIYFKVLSRNFYFTPTIVIIRENGSVTASAAWLMLCAGIVFGKKE